jgi:hypothetical protein
MIDGGTIYSAVEVLQFNGPSATALQVGYDSEPALIPGGPAQITNIKRARVASRPKPVFKALPVATEKR